MQFYQYNLLLIVIVLVIISICNIAKMIIYVSKNNYSKKEVKQNIRNLMVSIGFLCIATLVYIILSFSNQLR